MTNSLGDRVPELFAHAGLVDIAAYVSDKVIVMRPPYASAHEAALREEAFARGA